MDDIILKSKRHSISRELESPMTKLPTAEEARNASHSWKVVLQETQSKLKITQNKTILIISILNIFSLSLILETFFGIRWLLVNETDDYFYWANLLSIEKVCKNPSQQGTSQILCQEADQIVYSSQISDLFTNGCHMDQLTVDDPVNLCSSIRVYRIIGVVASFGIWISMLIHLFSISQFLKLSSVKGKPMVSQPVFQKVLITNIVFYLVSWLGWLVASVLMTDDNTQSSFFGRLGVPFYIFLLGVASYIALIYWFGRSLAAGAKMKLVNDLLAAETKYTTDTPLDNIDKVTIVL